MDFMLSSNQVMALLQREGRVTYRALKRQFDLDDNLLADLKAEMIKAKRLAIDEDGEILVWTGVSGTATPPAQPAGMPASRPPQTEPPPPDAERRQLTVMFADLVDSTKLSSQLDPEDYRDVLRAYQQTCAEVIHRFDGYIAQHLGEALLVYFGCPQAHDNDAHRSILAGLGMLAAMQTLSTRLQQEQGRRLSIRVGIHTGLTVIGDIGAGQKHELLALGEAPNVAARIQGIVQPDAIAISAATLQLVEGYFTCQDFGVHLDVFQRTWQIQEGHTSEEKLRQLEQTLSQYQLPADETIPLLAPLLSLTIPADRYPPLHWTPPRRHMEQGIAYHNLQQQHAYDFLYSQAPGGQCLQVLTWTLWCLGYPEQALSRSQAARHMARALAHSQAAATHVLCCSPASVTPGCRCDLRTV
jgi:class 3 adenylate cyclase